MSQDTNLRRTERSTSEPRDVALCLSVGEWKTMEGICNHYLMATAWADSPREVEPGKEVVARRALCKRILEAN